MSEYLDLLQRRLVDASARITAERRRRRRRRGAGLAAVVVLAGAPALSAATGLWRPASGEQTGTPVRISAESPPADQRALLGVLRRPQTAADRGAPTLAALRWVDGRRVDGLRSEGVRLLAASGVVLVPVARYDLGLPNPPPGARPEMKTALAPKPDGLCVLSMERTQAANGKCHSTADVRDGRAWFSIGNRETWLVPDGVARVRTEYLRGGTAEAEVRDNLAVYDQPAGDDSWQRATFYDAQGGVIRVIDVPDMHPGAARAQAKRAAKADAKRDPVAPGSTRGGVVRSVAIRGEGLSAHYMLHVRVPGLTRPTRLQIVLHQPACAEARKRRVRSAIVRRRSPSAELELAPWLNRSEPTTWCPGRYAGEIVTGRRTIGTFSFRATR